MSLDKLKEYMKCPNIAEELDEEELIEIGQIVKLGFDTDLSSMAEWLEDAKKVMDLASLRATKKNTPLPQSANIKFPIITKAAYEFSSRTYPEIIKDGQVVKTRIIGKDPTDDKKKRAERVADFMNYQLMFENTDWEFELDKLLTMLPLIGFVCKKTYYEPIRSQIKSEICEYDELVIHSKTKSLAEAERISHIIHLSLNEALEQVRSGLYCEKPIKVIVDRLTENDLRPMVDVIEQHCFIDLDEDDYAEPCIVTILKETGEVLRIVTRIKEEGLHTKDDKVQYIDAMHYFTDYHFLVNPKGHFQSVGFGILMCHLNETINTMLNQITDAGTLANLQCGYIDSKAKIIPSGNSEHDQGELKQVKTSGAMALKDAIHMVDFKEPSSVLYQTLGLLIQTSRDLAGVTDVMTGASGTENVKTGAVLALQEAGKNVSTGIQKRIYRSLTDEFMKLFLMNNMYLDTKTYISILDDDLAVEREDFDVKSVAVLPIADPNLSSEAQRAAKAQVLAGILQMPGINPPAVTKRILESTNIENPDELLVDPKQPQQPNPDVIKIQADIQEKAEYLHIEGRKQDLAEKQFQLQALTQQSVIILNRAKALQAVAMADASQKQAQLNVYDLQLKAIQTQLDHMLGVGTLNIQDMQHQDQMGMQQQQMQQDQGQHEDQMQQQDEDQVNAQQQQQAQSVASPSGQ